MAMSRRLQSAEVIFEFWVISIEKYNFLVISYFKNISVRMSTRISAVSAYWSS